MLCHLFFKKKEKRKLIKSRFSKVMHLSLKLWAFGYVLCPLSGTSKNHPPLFKKKGKETIFKKIKVIMHKVSKLRAFVPASFR